MTVWRLGKMAMLGVVGAFLLACGGDDYKTGSTSGSGGGGAVSGATGAAGTSTGSGGTAGAGASASGGSGGSTGDGGATSGTGAAGGQGPLPAAPRGASSFATTSDGCNVGSDIIFAIPWDPSQLTTSTVCGTQVADGQANATISCTVSAQGDGVEITGSLQQGSRSLTVSGTVQPVDGGGYSGDGTITHYDDASDTLQSESDGCTITVNPNQDIAAGRVWGNFDCATVTNPTSPGVQCSAAGSFVLENCAS